MTSKWSLAGLAMGAAMAVPAAASADEPGLQLKAGLIAHNICLSSCNNAGKEDGPIVDVQLNFRSPGVLAIIGAPRPYVALAPNVSGDTSYAAVGLEWRWQFAEKWALTPGLGYALHDGATNNPFRNGTPQATQFNRDHILHGSNDLFRLSAGVERRLGEHWSIEGVVLHYSHGQMLGHGRNQGNDQAGVRFGYSF